MKGTRLTFSLGQYEAAVKSCLNNLQQDRIVERIWEQDYTVWKPSPDNIINRLGWLNAPADTLKKIQYIRSEIVPIINSGIKDVVLLGMGGSSLAAEVFKDVFGSTADCPTLRILDTTDPATIAAVTASLNPDKTLFIVSSKSGTTLEVNSLFQYFYNLLLKKSKTRARGLFLFITDEGSPMIKLAGEVSSLPIFLNNPAIGGRYSALSLPGIVPAAIIGVDVEKLLQNAVSVMLREKTHKSSGNLDDTGTALGATLGTLAQMGRDKLTLIMPSRFASFGNWLEQLIAESTGKEGKRILPVTGESLSEPGAYGNDRVFVIFPDGDEDSSPKIASLAAAGHPVITIKSDDIYELGAQMFIWEMATAVAAYILKINPFDQPDVEATKVLTSKMIAMYREERALPQEEPSLLTPELSIYGGSKAATPAEALHDFLTQAKEGAYVSIQAYLSRAPQMDEALQQLKTAINRKYRLAVTVGYGPCYLHSTGQLHKGDAGNSLFIQLTADDFLDLDIPDRIGSDKSSLTFGTLKAAQALGDRQALIELGRKVIRFHFAKNATAHIKILANSMTIL
jgi:glucose-6-phosphate isomerase